jgi:hypothetical protein
MTKFIGRRFNIGVGRETVRGTARPVQRWLPTTELTFDEKVEMAKEESVFGVIENQTDADVVKTFAEGSISGLIDDNSIGYILYGALGTVGVSGPATGAYTHTFTVTQSSQIQSLTLTASEPNAQTSASLLFPLTVIDSLDLDFEVGQYPTYSASFMSNVSSTTTATVSYVAPANFRPQDGVVRIATTYAGLASGTTYAVRKASISISKNVEDDHNIGSIAVTDRLNKQFGVTGSLEIVYDARTNITELLTNATRAIQLEFTNTNKTIVGGSINPKITIRLAKVKFVEVARNIGKDDIVMQTMNFEAFYSLGDTRMIDVVLVNDVASYA